MEERIALLRESDNGAFPVTNLGRRHGINRATSYLWKRCRASGDPHWFEARSHAVEHCPDATAACLAAWIVATRGRFPHFGTKKVKA